MFSHSVGISLPFLSQTAGEHGVDPHAGTGLNRGDEALHRKDQRGPQKRRC